MKLTEGEWSRISEFLQGQRGVYKAKSADTRQFLDGVYWVLRTGAQWRELPEAFGKWTSVHSRFLSWSKRGIFEALLAHLSTSGEEDLEWLSVDSTVIRAHMCATPAKEEQAAQGLGRGRGGFSTKLHLKVDSHGLPLKLALTAGQRADSIGWP